VKEVIDEEARERGGVVPNDAVLFEEIAGDEADFGSEDFFAIEEDRFGAFGAVTAGDTGRDGFAIGDDSIEDAAAGVGLDGAKMVAKSVVSGFARLRHEVGDVNARSLGTGDCVSDFGDQQIRDDAGVERTGAHQDEVGLLDGFDRGGKSANAAWGEFNFANGNVAAGNASFTLYALAVGKSGDEVDVG